MARRKPGKWPARASVVEIKIFFEESVDRISNLPSDR